MANACSLLLRLNKAESRDSGKSRWLLAIPLQTMTVTAHYVAHGVRLFQK